MQPFAGFTGPSYSTIPAIALEKTGNYFCAAAEVPGATKTEITLFQRPGSVAFTAVPAPVSGRARGSIQFDGNNVVDGAAFGVNGITFFQLGTDGTMTPLGTVVDDGLPVGICANAATTGQVAVTSGGNLYVLSVNTGIFAQITSGGDFFLNGTLASGSATILMASTAGVFGGQLVSGAGIPSGASVVSVNANTSVTLNMAATAPGTISVEFTPQFFGALACAFIDGYLLVLSDTPNKQQFQISGLNDMTSWSGADVAVLLGQTDPIINLEVSQEYVHFIGSRRGEIWYNTGNAGFPFAIEPGAFIETGIGAKDSLVKMGDGSLCWIGQDARGGKIALRSAGLQTERISDHTVEAAWQRYATTSDCWCYSMQWIGHQVVRYIFPTAQAGWQYDATESARLGYAVWTELYFTDTNGNQLAPVERSYCYAFGKHLIGSGGADGTPGVIYAMDPTAYSDCVGGIFGMQAATALATTMTSGPLNPGDTVLTVSTADLAPTPFFFTINGQELCRCDLIGGAVAWSIVRGLGSVPAGTWDEGATLAVVTLPGFPLTRDRIVRLPWNGGLRQFLDRLEFALQVGVGTDSGQGANPQMLVRISRDGGNTWGREIQVPLGAGGQYLTRVGMNRLGSYRDGAIWIRITDPVFCAIAGAQHYIRAGGS